MVSAAEAWNARLREQSLEGFELDATRWPHVTLLQQYVAEADLDAVLAAVGEVAARHDVDGLELTAIGLYYIRTGEIGLQGITIEPSPELLALQADVVETLAPYRQSGGDEAAFVPDRTGTPFDPILFEYVETFVPAQTDEKQSARHDRNRSARLARGPRSRTLRAVQLRRGPDRHLSARQLRYCIPTA